MGKAAARHERPGEVIGCRMRLVEHSLHCYSLRYERPVQWSDVVEVAAPFVLLRLVGESGATGVAEITVKPTWCGVTARSLIASLEEIFLPLLARLDLNDPAAVRVALDRIPDNAAAKTLIDNACWDLAAAADGKPLWRRWGGRQHVPMSFALTRQTPILMAAEAEAMVARHGFAVLKVKGGQGFETDQEGMRAIRAAVGHGIRLYVDANGAYPREEAARYAALMADAGAEMVEDPGPLEPDANFSALQAGCPVPVLVDFGCTSLRDAEQFMARGARALSIKPGRFGLTQSRAMHRAAHAAGCQPVVGLMGESALGTLTGLQFAATLDETTLPAELTWYLAMQEQVTVHTPRIAGGMLELPAAGSVASLVDWAAVEAFSRETRAA